MLGAGLSVRFDDRTITVVAAPDPHPATRRVPSITHCYGALPGEDDDPRQYGANPARLLSLTEHRQPISLMPWMSAVPVTADSVRNEPASTDQRHSWFADASLRSGGQRTAIGVGG